MLLPIFDRKDCTNVKVFLDASMKLHELEPSPESAYNIGVKLFGEKNYRQAAEYFEQSTSSENSERVYRAYRTLSVSAMLIPAPSLATSVPSGRCAPVSSPEMLFRQVRSTSA